MFACFARTRTLAIACGDSIYTDLPRVTFWRNNNNESARWDFQAIVFAATETQIFN